MKYLNRFFILVFIFVGMTSCTPDPIEDQKSTTEILATENDPEVTPPPSEETGEDDELEPNG